MSEDRENKAFLDKEAVWKQIDDYKKFAFGQNMFAMALTLILAQVVQKFVTALSDSLLMPFINYLVSATGGDWRNLLFVPAQGLEIEIGKLIGGFLEFTVTTAFIYTVYMHVVKRIDPNSKIGVKN
jgi:large-conductance mechanosensitive channel